jgi:peptidoglycan/xylan/chitin deacetylase (PgdA/CDA1 family)
MRKTVVFRLIRLTMLPLLIRETIQRRRTTVIYYHDPSPETLRAHLAVLRRRYNLISLRQFVEAHRMQSTRTLPPKSLVVSLDDGHAGNVRLKPVLEELGVPVTIFLCSGIVGTGRRFWFKHVSGEVESLKHVPDVDRLERLRALGFDEARGFSEAEALSRDEIEELSRLVNFQSHTVSHPVLPFCTSEKAEHEIVGSKQELENSYGFDIYAISYPNGDYSDREILLAKHAGYRCALTADAGFNSDQTDPFRMKRIYIGDNDGVDELLVRTSGLWDRMKGIFRPKTFGYTATPAQAPRERSGKISASPSGRRARSA